MALIEGVGDEVVQFMGAVLLLVVGMLAWRSTNARPDRYRTVLLMRSQRHHPVTVSIRTRPNIMAANTQTSNTTQSNSDSSGGSADDTPEGGRREARVIPLQEMDSIEDADMAMLDDHRMHFYRRIDSPGTPQTSGSWTSEQSETQEEAQPASTAQMREMDSIVSAMEADVTTACECRTRPRTQEPTSDSTTTKKEENKSEKATSSDVNKAEVSIAGGGSEGPSGDAGKILIKLKYLNDTLREVEGSLDELLKDFKWRHFSAELSRECRVVLIFNGRVLVDDSTLRALGLHDRAVVHALVHPKRNHNQPRLGSEARPLSAPHELLTEGVGGGGAGGLAGGTERVWDLENILMTLVSVALTIVWFFRCEYSNMFTASASVALFGLTVFYSVAIFGLYLSDTFHFDRRGATAPPANNAPPQPQPQTN